MLSRDAEKVRKKSTAILDYLSQKLRELPFVQSVSLIGKRLEEGRGIERINDLDLVVLAEGSNGQLQMERYEAMRRLLEDIRNGRSKDTDVLYAIADGPLKPKTNLANEIFIHFLLHTPETYRSSPLVLVQNSWQYESPIFGRHLSEYRRVHGVNVPMLLLDPLGIVGLQELVRTDSSAYLGWTQNSDGLMEQNLVPVKFTELEEKMELYLYATLRGASNVLRYFMQDNTIGIDLVMAQKFQQYFSDSKFSYYPSDAWQTKRDLRDRRLLLPASYVGSKQAETLEFLVFLENQVKSKRRPLL